MDEQANDYIVRMTVTLAVRVEGWDTAENAISRARDMLDEEIDPTSFYVKGTPEIESVERVYD